MYETPDDLARLQALIDHSYDNAGAHLRSIHTPDRRMTAVELVERLAGISVLVVATVTRDGRPLTGAVDGLFYRGQWWFGSSPDSVRFGHLRERPAVSATHARGEELAVTVHGAATEVDLDDPAHEGFRRCCVDVYGAEWTQWGSDAAYARIDADRFFTWWLPAAVRDDLTGAVNAVRGIGGVFLRAEDPDALAAWYEEHLGIDTDADYRSHTFRWRDERDDLSGSTVWSIFGRGDERLGIPSQQAMVAYRVDDLDVVLARLAGAGIEPLSGPAEDDQGRFAWIRDPEGHRFELWEPAPGL